MIGKAQSEDSASVDVVSVPPLADRSTESTWACVQRVSSISRKAAQSRTSTSSTVSASRRSSSAMLRAWMRHQRPDEAHSEPRQPRAVSCNPPIRVEVVKNNGATEVQHLHAGCPGTRLLRGAQSVQGSRFTAGAALRT
jgi:hypothetical protein